MMGGYHQCGDASEWTMVTVRIAIRAVFVVTWSAIIFVA